MKEVKEKKKEVVVLTLFSVFIVILSMSEWAYIPVSDNMFLDLSVIPAVIAFLVGGWRAGMGVAMVWTVTGFVTGPIPPDSLFWPTLIIKMTFAFVTWKSYDIAKKIRPGSPDCMYVAVLVGQFIRWFMTLGTFSLIRGVNYFVNEWMYIWMALETILCLAGLYLFVKRLRKVHVTSR